MRRGGALLFALATGAVAGAIIVRRRFDVADIVGPLADAADPVPKSEAGSLVRDFLRDMNASGDNADEIYAQTLARLREEGAAVAAAFADSYRAAPHDAYPLRWALVYGAARLEHSAASEFLQEVLRSPMPPERSDDHYFSSVKEESIIRTTAVEGLGRLSADDPEAERALIESLSHSTFSVRVAAAQTLLEQDDSADMRDRLRQRLPVGEEFILDIKRLDVEEVPQVDPRQHLTPRAQRAVSAPVQPLPGDAPARPAGVATRRGAPRIPNGERRG